MKIKRLLILFMVLGLVAGSVATAEAKRTRKPTRIERTIEGSYGALPEPVTGCNEELGSFACIVVGTRPGEAFFTAKATDAHGRPVFVRVVGNGGYKAIGSFCGETTRPISFDPGSSLEFRIEAMPNFWSNWGVDWLGPRDCLYRLKTFGTISVTLSNLP